MYFILMQFCWWISSAYKIITAAMIRNSKQWKRNNCAKMLWAATYRPFVRFIRSLIDTGESVSCLRASLTTSSGSRQHFMIISRVIELSGRWWLHSATFPLNENHKNRRRRVCRWRGLGGGSLLLWSGWWHFSIGWMAVCFFVSLTLVVWVECLRVLVKLIEGEFFKN